MWLDILKNYDMLVRFYTVKANIVASTLTKMFMVSVTHTHGEKKELARLGVKFVDSSKGGFTVYHSSKSSLVVDVKSK